MAKILSALGPFAPFVVFFLAAAESAAFVGLVVPGEVAVILGGVAAGTGAVPLWSMIAASVIGAVVGDSIGYRLGHRLGPALLERPRYAKVAEHMTSASQIVADRGWWALVVARFTSILRAVVPFAAGMGRMPYSRFLVGNVIGGLAWGVTFTLVGYTAGANYPTVEKWFRTGGLAIAGLLAIVGGIVLATRWLARHPDTFQNVVRPFLKWRPVSFILSAISGTKRATTLVVSGVTFAGSLWLFSAMVQDVLGREEFFFFDQSVLAYLNANRVPWLISIAETLNAVTALPIIVGIGAVASIYHMTRRRVRASLAIGFVILGQWLTVEGIGPLIHRAPPPFTPLAARIDYGFPSEQVAAVAALLTVAVWPWITTTWPAMVRRVGAAAIIVSLVAASRIVLLIEYPSDVMAAVAVGTGWAILILVATGRPFVPSVGRSSGPSESEAK